MQQRLAGAARAPVALPGGYVAHPSHAFAVEAVVLSRRAYRFDAESAVSPLDLLLGWGPMSDPAVLTGLSTRQSGRFGYVRPLPDSAVDLRALGPYWSNMHLIPGDDAVAAALEQVGEGRVVRLTGALVTVRGAGGWVWRSSLSRTDSGAGACELLLVTEVQILR